MFKRKLLKAKLCGLDEKIPPLDCIYIIPTRKKHDSGYMCMEIIGLGLDNKWLKKLSTRCDVVNLEKTFFKRIPLFLLSMDVEEYGILRFFVHGGKFIVTRCHYSDLNFSIMEDKNES